jgi:hypothetical protein
MASDSFVIYHPGRHEDVLFRQMFLQQATQAGFGAGFVGNPYQRGAGLGSVFGSIFRAVAPLAKSALRTVGKTALKTGLSVASDALAGRNVVESLEDHGKSGAAHLLSKASKKLNKKKPPATKRKKKQKGRGLGRRPARAAGLKTIKAGRKVSKDIFDD